MTPTVLVTGATSGIGRALVEQLAAQGRPCLAVGRSCSDGTEGTTTWLRADLTSPVDRAAIADAASDVHIAVHAAGLCIRGALENLAEADVRETLEVDLVAPILLTRLLLPSLRKHKGVLVGVSSLAGRIGSPGNALYSAAKFGLDGWLEATSYELATVGIRTRVVVPLYAATSFMERAASREPDPAGPYAAFEHAARARLSGSLETATPPCEVAAQTLFVIDAACESPPGFDGLCSEPIHSHHPLRLGRPRLVHTLQRPARPVVHATTRPGPDTLRCEPPLHHHRSRHRPVRTSGRNRGQRSCLCTTACCL